MPGSEIQPAGYGVTRKQNQQYRTAVHAFTGKLTSHPFLREFLRKIWLFILSQTAPDRVLGAGLNIDKSKTFHSVVALLQTSGMHDFYHRCVSMLPWHLSTEWPAQSGPGFVLEQTDWTGKCWPEWPSSCPNLPQYWNIRLSPLLGTYMAAVSPLSRRNLTVAMVCWWTEIWSCSGPGGREGGRGRERSPVTGDTQLGSRSCKTMAFGLNKFSLLTWTVLRPRSRYFGSMWMSGMIAEMHNQAQIAAARAV